MRRILNLDIVLFAVGLVLGVALESPAAVTALVGTLSSLYCRVRFGRVWAAAPLGLFAATSLVNLAAPAPSLLERLLDDGPSDFMVSGRLEDGPRAFPHGQGYEMRVELVDGEQASGLIRVHAMTPGSAVAGDYVRSFLRCSLFAPPEFPGDRGDEARWRARGFVARCSGVEPIVAQTRRDTTSSAIRRALTKRRLGVEARLRHVLGRRAGVPIAMLTGTRGLITDSEIRAHQRAGTAHLLAISGVHFGALAAIVWAIASVGLRRWPRVTRSIGARRASAGVVLVTMLAYLLLVGAPISAVRAFIAMSAIALGLMLGRRPSGLAAVSAAAIGLLALSPQLVWDLGFQLSFVATLAIVLFWARLPASVERDHYAFERDSRRMTVARSVWRFVLMSWAATAATAPILLGALGELSLVAFATNVVAVPLVSLVLFPTLLAGSALLELAPTLGEPIVWWATEAMLRLTIALEQCADLPGAVLNPGTAPGWWVATTVGSVFAVLSDRTRARAVLFAALLTAVTTTMAFRPRPAEWTLHLIPVGQGDATLIETPDGRRVLIDAGGASFGRDPGRWIVVPYLRRLGIQSLDALIVTHADSDHAGGVPAVLEHIDVRRLALDPEDLGITGLQLQRWQDEGSRNDRSIIATIRAGPAVALLTGDAEASAEQAWLDDRPHRVHVLKVGHHGSKTSTTEPFIGRSRPIIAVVSAGRFNRFGHPHPTVTARLARYGARTFSTPDHGVVKISLEEEGAITTRVRRP